MPWDEITGQDRAVQLLQRAIALGHLHHAYLLAGPDGVGKELFARLAAQAANCEREPAERPCGACSSCTGIARGTFPDVFWVRPQSELVKRGLINKADLENAPSREIRVDEVRQLSRRLAFSLVRGRRKIAIVSPADALNERAQNTLLKTLEEPPPQTTFFLISSKPDELLPTVRSRCARLSLAPLSPALIASLLSKQGVPAAEAEAKAARAEGSLARAMEMTSDELQRRTDLSSRLTAALAAADERDVLDLAESHSDRDAAAELVAVLRESIRQGLVSTAHEGGDSGLAAPFLREHELCNEVELALEQNGNPRLQLERVLLGARAIRMRARKLSSSSSASAPAGGAHAR